MATEKQIAANRLNAKKGGRKRGPRTQEQMRRREEKERKKFEREIVMEELRARVGRMMPALTNAQAALAKGLTFLYVIKTDKKGNKGSPQIITDTETIEAYLADELENDDREYYFMATEKPNNSALDSLQDRAWGKPTQPIGGPNNGPISIEIVNYGKTKT